MEGQPYEEGQEAGSSSIDLSSENGRPQRQPNGDLWRPEDENYYNAEAGKSSKSSKSSGRWHYPMNFEDVEPIDTGKRSKKKKDKKDKKDRWERTQDAYSMASESDKKKKKKKRRSTKDTETGSTATQDSGEFPEDPAGGLYGDRRTTADSEASGAPKNTTDDVFRHEF